MAACCGRWLSEASLSRIKYTKDANNYQRAAAGLHSWIKNVVTTQSELILKYTTDFIKNAASSLTVNKEYWSSYRICIVSASVAAVVYKFFLGVFQPGVPFCRK